MRPTACGFVCRSPRSPVVVSSSCTTPNLREMWGLRETFRRLMLVAVLLAAAPASHSLERWERLADPVFEHLAHDNELPNAAIPMSAAQDGDGFLWIGSQNGLARWD